MSIHKTIDSGKDEGGDISFDSIGEGNTHHTAILLFLLFILSGFSAFALGRLSVQEQQSQRSVVIETIPPDFFDTNSPTSNSVRSIEGGEDVPLHNSPLLVGSKNSDKYHFPWCSGAKRIKPENLLFFSSYEEARNAGYTPASNCDGLQ
jgi:hypothetical protein